MATVGFTPSGAVVAENVRDLQTWLSHVVGASARYLDLLFLAR